MKKRAAPTRWHKLDNTANIFPVVASRRYSNVFRDSRDARGCGPCALQQALEQTLPYFAAFNVRLRHGLFWNYLETNRATPQILPEQDAPLPLYRPRGDRPLSVPCAVLRQPRASGDLPRAHGRHGRDAF